MDPNRKPSPLNINSKLQPSIHSLALSQSLFKMREYFGQLCHQSHAQKKQPYQIIYHQTSENNAIPMQRK